MRLSLEDAIWSRSEIAAAVEAVARAAGLPVSEAATAASVQDVESAALALGLEVEPERVAGSNCQTVLREGAPGILEYADGVLGVVQALGPNLAVICPDWRIRKLSISAVEEVLLAGFKGPLQDIDKMLDDAGIRGKRRDHSRRALVREYMTAEPISLAWQLRVPCGASFGSQMSNARLWRSLVTAGIGHFLEYVVWVASWILLGRSVLEGRIDKGLLFGWILMLASIVPLRMVSRWSQGRAGIGISGLLKQRLMAGACRIRSELIRSDGPGGLLGRVLEAEVIENLGINAGFGSLFGAAELLVSAIILGIAPGAGGALVALLAYGGACALVVRGYWKRRALWTARRIGITRHLIERLCGYRTVLAQLPRERWHEAEDAALSEYAQESRKLDRFRNVLVAAIPTVWIILGCACVTPMFLSGHSAGPLAAALGGVLLARTAFTRITLGLADLAAASLAIEAVRPIFRAAQEIESTRHIVAHSAAGDLEARNLQAGYEKDVLSGASLTVRPGERVILSGAPAAGRTTLGAVLAGLADPNAGLVLLSGLDRAAVGEQEWRRRVALALQGRDNHVFTGTLAFNLLMSRRMPPMDKDMAEAMSVCAALGLDSMLQRMPAGLEQFVGESGWQLSEGEKSRVYVARSILQNSGVLILDDALAALDARTRSQVLSWLSARPESVILLTC